MKWILAVLIASIIFIAGCQQQEPVFCTEEAKQCPDGSFVSRNPSKNCEFDPCKVEIVNDVEQCLGGEKATCADGTVYNVWNVVDGKCVQINYFVDPCRQEFDSRENCLTMGGDWDENKKTCEYPTGRVMQLTPEICRQAGGNWNECGSVCTGYGPECAGITVCVPQCECGGIAGFSCPAGYDCRLSGKVADEIGVCVPKANV